MKFLNLFVICILCMSASKCSTSKHYAPLVGDCVNMVKVHSTHDEVLCSCVDKRIKDNASFDKYLKSRVLKAIPVDYPERDAVLDYLEEIRESAIENHEYEIPAIACQNFRMVQPNDFSLLENKFEDNRVERIKCEKKLGRYRN